MPGGVLRPSPWAIDDKVDRFKRGAPSSHGRDQKRQPIPDLLRISKPQAAKLKPAGAPWAVEEDNSNIFAKPSNIIGAGIQFTSNFGDESDPDDQKDVVRPQSKGQTRPPPTRGTANQNQARGINGGPQDGWIGDHPDETVILSDAKFEVLAF